MLDPKYGRIVTTMEAILYDLLMEQRRTNELLARISTQEKAVAAAPVEEQTQPVRRRKRREG